MKTIIELFDRETILNILAVCAFDPAPEQVVFVGDFGDRRELESIKDWTAGFLAARGIESRLYFRDVDTSDCSAIIEELFAVEREFPECVLEISGGKYLSLLAAGMFAENTDIPIFHYDIDRRNFADIRGFAEANEVPLPYFSARDVFELSQAGTLGYGHFSPPQLDLEAREDARQLWYIFLAHRSDWHEIVLFFQSADTLPGSGLAVDTNRMIKNMSSRERDQLLEELAEAGLITRLRKRGSQVQFTYKSSVVRAMLQDAGAALELFTYACIKRRADHFWDCEINIRIDWDGEGPSATSNELDVVAMCGLTPLFISCKSGRLQTAHLNEIYTVTKKLGGLFARPVLMTAALGSADDNRWMLQRASDMGIAQIGLDDICPRFAQKRYTGLSDCRTCPRRECENRLAELLAAVCD